MFRLFIEPARSRHDSLLMAGLKTRPTTVATPQLRRRQRRISRPALRPSRRLQVRRRPRRVQRPALQPSRTFRCADVRGGSEDPPYNRPAPSSTPTPDAGLKPRPTTVPAPSGTPTSEAGLKTRPTTVPHLQ